MPGSAWGLRESPGIHVNINQTITLDSISHSAPSKLAKHSSASSSGLCKGIRFPGSCVVIAVVINPGVPITIPLVWQIAGCPTFTCEIKVLMLLFEQRDRLNDHNKIYLRSNLQAKKGVIANAKQSIYNREN